LAEIFRTAVAGAKVLPRLLLVAFLVLSGAFACGNRHDARGDDDDVGSDGDADSDGDGDADGCPEEWGRCDGACVHLTVSSVHCGRCNNPCTGDQSCQLGECLEE
jgi:hypothetical protein